MSNDQILVYFIDEAKEHLQTIENGLMNIEEMLADEESINEVFRAAHSIKGGAAMLTLKGIQHTSHRLEDYFKILKENPSLPVDKELQNLFLQGFDKLQDLLIELQSPGGLTPAKEEEVLREADPIFDQLKQHLDALLTGSAAPSVMAATAQETTTKNNLAIFQKEVTEKLRAMLQCFKQPDRANSRNELQKLCDQLLSYGEEYQLPQWNELIRSARLAVTNLNNQYRDLAPILIREIKQAQDMVLANRTLEITVSPQMRSLAPNDFFNPMARSEDEDISTFFNIVEDPPEVERWKEFAKTIGWLRGPEWINSDKIDYTINAPQGHLPAPIWLEHWEKPKDKKAELLRKEYELFIQRFKECS
jgi:chemosensory pili system protein ChpA (sensor histidine kinase/response regulator)